MAYPSVVTNFSTKVNGQVIDASDVNNVQTDVVAIETFVGTIASTAGSLIYDIRSANSAGGGHIQAANVGGTGQTAFSKGDILVASSASVLSKLTVGTNGQGLFADSTQQTGVKWGPAATGRTTTSGISSTLTNITVTHNLGAIPKYIRFDTYSNHIAGTNYAAVSAGYVYTTAGSITSSGAISQFQNGTGTPNINQSSLAGVVALSGNGTPRTLAVSSIGSATFNVSWNTTMDAPASVTMWTAE